MAPTLHRAFVLDRNLVPVSTQASPNRHPRRKRLSLAVAGALAFSACAPHVGQAQSWGGSGGYSTDDTASGTGGSGENAGQSGEAVQGSLDTGGGGSGGGGGGSGADGGQGGYQLSAAGASGGHAGAGVTTNGNTLTGGDGQAGSTAPAVSYPYDQGAGGGGGGGGAAAYLHDASDVAPGLNGLVLVGGKGGAGGAGAGNSSASIPLESGGGGGGGAGGYGLVVDGGNSFTLINTTVTGGKGGNGGNGGASGGGLSSVPVGVIAGGGGYGGDGGIGALVRGASTLINGGSITGGDGGTGGAGGAGGVFYGGGGGNGGTGVDLADGSSLINTGIIVGGNAGASTPTTTGVMPSAALAGVGVTAGGDTVVVNSGTISAGTDASGVRGATALMFTGDGNRLELQAGSAFVGNVIVGFGTNNTLALGGTTNSTLDVSSILPIASVPVPGTSVFYGFSGYEKTGTSVWTLTNSTSAVTNWTIKAGTLAVTSDSNLGDASGTVTLDGGALSMGNGFTSARNFVLTSNGGTLGVTSLSSATITSAISGPGSLTKTGTGILVLAAANTYTGMTYVKEGSLLLGSQTANGSILGDIDLAANTAVGFASRDATIYSGQISGHGALIMTQAPLTLLGTNTYTGGTVVYGTTLQIGNGGTIGSIVGDVYLDDSSSILAFNRSDNITFGGSIQGRGVLNQIGAGTLALTGDSSVFMGQTTVSQGTLQVDGSLGGPVMVADTATLAGSGQVGATHVANGATLAPGSAGNPGGTLTVNGDLVLDSGSTYRVMAAADGSHSAVSVTGAATLAGAVVQVGSGTTYAARTTYGILQAAGGLSGQFSSVQSNYAYLDPKLAYAGNQVNLVVDLKQVPDTGGGDTSTPPANGGGDTPTPPGNGGGDASNPPTGGGTRDIRFADLAANGNQRAVANALQSLPETAGLYGRVLNLPVGTPAEVFASLSGEAHANLFGSLHGVTDRVGSLALSHLQSNLGAGSVAGPATAQWGGGDASALPQSAAQPVWAQIFGSWRTQSGTDDTARSSESDSGIFVGGDQAVGGGWRVGGALGYTDGRNRLRDLDSRTDVDSYSATVYGGKAFAAGAGKINLSLGAAYTWHDVKTRRQANAAGVGEELKSSYGASTGQFFGELGYAVPLNDRVTLEPFMGASYSDLRTRGFAESGGDAALSGESARNQIAATTLGLHAQSAFESAGAAGRVRATLGWRHAYGDVNPETTLAFQGSQAFTITGAPIARNTAVLELGVDMSVTKRTTVGLNYGGQFGSGTRQNAGSLDVRYRF